MTALPRPADLWRPKLHPPILSQLVQDTWKAINDRITAERQSSGVADAVAVNLAARFPEDDMAVLARYGFARPRADIAVRCKDHLGSWSISVGVALREPLMLPDRADCSAPTCNTPDPECDAWGLKPAFYARADVDEVVKVRAGVVESRKRDLPDAVLPFFQVVVDARRAYQAEYRSSTAFPADFKAANGRYPTWQDIAEAFPTLGAHLHVLWASEQVSA